MPAVSYDLIVGHLRFLPTNRRANRLRFYRPARPQARFRMSGHNVGPQWPYGMQAFGQF